MYNIFLKKIFKYGVYFFALIGLALTAGFFAVKFGLTNTTGIVDQQREYFLAPLQKPLWGEDEEWQTFETAVSKDKTDIDKASGLSGVPVRLIVAQLASEQLRLFHSEREIFKTVFAPLKILGNQSQFSWGVMGLKQETARMIESNLKNQDSPFYLGKEYENLLDFKTKNPDRERFERITDEDSRFYSYLYTGLYLKQIMTQWKNAGYDISARPEILSTLFNIGFSHSEPKQNPEVGGSAIEIGEKIYSFGGLSAEFYYSKKLEKEFPL